MPARFPWILAKDEINLLVLIALAGVGLSACSDVSVLKFNAEGDAEGECSNDADEDEDSLFDCDDPDCAGSDECNQSPSAPGVTITPSEPTSDDALDCEVTSPSEDLDGDEVVYGFAWSIDGGDAGISDERVEPALTSAGQLWTCTVTPYDGSEYGPAGAATVVIEDVEEKKKEEKKKEENTPPGAPEVSIEPTAPFSSDDLYCVIETDSVDADGDAVSYAYQWHQNGKDVGLSSDTVTSDHTEQADEWTCIVTPNDGEDDGETGEASTVIEQDPCYSASFNGKSSSITIEDNTDLDTTVFTAMFWAKLDGAQDGHLVAKGNNDTTEWSFTHSSAPDGVLYFNHQNVSNLISWPDLPYGEWFHAAAVSDGSSVELYANGDIVGTAGFSFTPSPTELLIGNISGCDFCAILGEMSQVAVFDDLLSDTDIQSIYEFSASPADFGSVMAYWPLDEGSGSIAYDASGNGHDGDMLDTTWVEECPEDDE